MDSRKNLEQRMRRLARRHDMRLEKSRQRGHSNNRGEYMLIDNYHNYVVEGREYDMTLEQVEQYFRETK